MLSLDRKTALERKTFFYLLFVFQGYMRIIKTKQQWETGYAGAGPYY